MTDIINQLLRALDTIQTDNLNPNLTSLPACLHSLCHQEIKRANLMAFFAIKTSIDFPFYALAIEIRNQRQTLINKKIIESFNYSIDSLQTMQYIQKLENLLVEKIHEEFIKEWKKHENYFIFSPYMLERKKYFLSKNTVTEII